MMRPLRRLAAVRVKRNGDEALESPEWHGNALAETENRVQTGEVDSIEWDQAKADLRSRYNDSEFRIVAS